MIQNFQARIAKRRILDESCKQPFQSISLRGKRSDTVISSQWRRQDLLLGGAKIESMSWGTHGGLRGRVQPLLDD